MYVKLHLPKVICLKKVLTFLSLLTKQMVALKGLNSLVSLVESGINVHQFSSYKLQNSILWWQVWRELFLASSISRFETMVSTSEFWFIVFFFFFTLE